MTDLHHVHIGIAAFTACNVHGDAVLHDTEDYIPVNFFCKFLHRCLCCLCECTSLYNTCRNTADFISQTIFFCLCILNNKVISFQTCEYPMGRTCRDIQLFCKFRNGQAIHVPAQDLQRTQCAIN